MNLLSIICWFFLLFMEIVPCAGSGGGGLPNLCVDQTQVHQSPIDIREELLTVDPSLPPLYMSHVAHDDPVTIQLNPGDLEANKNLHCDIVDGQKFFLEGAGLKSTFYLHGLHFHTPSEHLINGHSTPLELHLVHFNHDIFKKGICEAACAMTHDDGVAVVSLMFEIGPNNTFIQELLDYTANPVTKEKIRTKIPLINDFQHWGKLIPLNLFNHFYTYFGSTTTPPCMTATWFIGQTRLTCSIEQLVQLMKLFTKGTNERKIQKLNNRKIYIRSRSQTDLYAMGYKYGYAVGYHHGSEEFPMSWEPQANNWWN